jgi:hypothetical protein
MKRCFHLSKHRLPQSAIPSRLISRSTRSVDYGSLDRSGGIKVKILAAVMLLTMVGCSGQSERFVPFVEDDSILALDTKTGQTCVSYKRPPLPDGGTPMPYCMDLYNSK